MKKFIIFIIFFLFSLNKNFASNYLCNLMPDSIKRNANAVLWNYSIEITVNKDLSFTEKVHKVVTVFKLPAIEHSKYFGYESKEMSSKLIKGVIYDDKGNIIKKIKAIDLNTIGEYSQFITDFKADYYDPQILKFPYTVEYIYETKYKYILNFPVFNPYLDYNISVINSSYTINAPTQLDIRINNINDSLEQKLTIKNNIKTYSFVLKNKPSINIETNPPSFDKIAPQIIVAPNQIKYYGYNGKFENWNDFGKWIIQLNNNRDSLPSNLKAKMKQYQIDYPDIVQRAKVIYNWVQDNTRYYSIQLGIGGYQPMKTLEVHNKKYGDCKALSYYTKTLFKEAGINAYYTLVKAGENKNILKNIAANQFNHVILCMPLENDTIWLECTDQKIPFGFLGSFTDDRDVLVVNDQPKIAHTKCYTINDNVKSIYAEINFNSDNTVNGNLIYSAKGLESETLYYADYLPSNELRQKFIYEMFSINNLEFKDVTIHFDKSIIPTKTLTNTFSVKNFTTQIGGKLIFEPNIFTRYKNNIILDTNRIIPFEQTKNFTEYDSILFHIPENFNIEDQQNIQFFSEFGYYSANFITNNLSNTLIYVRKLIINKGMFEASKISAYVDFVKKIKSSDNIKILMIPKKLVK